MTDDVAALKRSVETLRRRKQRLEDENLRLHKENGEMKSALKSVIGFTSHYTGDELVKELRDHVHLHLGEKND